MSARLGLALALAISIITGAAAAPRLSAQGLPAAGNQSGTRVSRTLPLRLGLRPGATLTLQADQLRATLTPGHSLYQASGHVVLTGEGLSLSADRMRYDAANGEATASGHVAFDSLSEQTHIEGTSARYNFLHSTGEFDNFHGISGIRLHGQRAEQTTSNPLVFSGRRLLRLGPDLYRLQDGTVTTCSMPDPKWTLSASQVQIQLGQNATLHHALFRLFDIPVFYAPFLTYPTTRQGRHSGVLVPVVSKSNIKGYVLGDSYYWAAARNLNLTLGGEYYSARGWADHLKLDSRPTRNSDFSLQLDGVFDRGLALTGGSRLRQGGQELRLTGDHTATNGFRSVLDVDYLSSYLYRLVFKNNFADAINSEAISTGFTERQAGGRDFSVEVHRYQDFLGSTPNATLTLTELPSLNWNAYAQRLSRHLPLYFSWQSSAGLLQRSEPGFATGPMSRLDFSPHLRLPVSTALGTFTADLSVDSTHYSERQTAPSPLSPFTTPQLLPGGLWRNAWEADLEWRPPVLAKVFSGPGGKLGDRLEHVFEPQAAYRVVSGIHDPNQVIRFDAGDILSDTRELEYGFTNRLLAASGPSGSSRELLSWTLLQKYYFDPSFGSALIAGNRNLFLTTALLSPFGVSALSQHYSPLSSVVRVSPFSRFDGEWRLDYDSHGHLVRASAFTGNFHFGKGFFTGSDYLLRPPPGLSPAFTPTQFHQLRLGGGYGDALSPGLSLAGAVAYDARSGKLQYTSFQLTQNWDCLGISVEYRRFALASVRRENQLLISFSLANLASFGNLKRQDQLF